MRHDDDNETDDIRLLLSIRVMLVFALIRSKRKKEAMLKTIKKVAVEVEAGILYWKR